MPPYNGRLQMHPEPDADPKDVDPTDPDYEGPEDGPFRCDNCEFFSAPNQCSQSRVVASRGGVVDPAGCCKFFDSLKGGSEAGEAATPKASASPSLAGLKMAGGQ